MDITTTLKKVATGLDFAAVVKSLNEGMHNISSSEADEVEGFLRERELLGTPCVFMATHSIGGRDWKIVEGRKPAFLEEKCFNGGWFVLTDGDVNYLHCSSATSGSSLTAEKQEDGSWKVSLEVPVGDDGTPYQGAYWRAFHIALGLEQPADENVGRSYA